jgi:hypothetical protein
VQCSAVHPWSHPRRTASLSTACRNHGVLVAIMARSRYVQVGNEFTGLYTEAKEKPPELLDVPLEIFGKPIALDPSRMPIAAALVESLGLRRRRLLRTQEEKGRAWLQGSYLQVLPAI